ncbi:hypothetical protein ACQY0O_006918 [Thecaphora frezii]
MERQREKEREKAKKALLWTTDQKVRREIAIMKKCSHQNVVRLREVIDDPQSKKIFMVLEFMEGGEIIWKDEQGRPTLTVDECRRTLRDVVCGLEYLHYQGIIHRDIKPANLLLDKDRRVKISDFGVSHFSYAMMMANEQAEYDGHHHGSAGSSTADPSLMDDHELAKTAGSPAFFAPELCMSGDATAGSLGASAADHQAANHQGDRRSEFALFAVIPSTDYAIPTFAGADRLKIGPRRPRWTSNHQWIDEESDAQPENPAELVPDAPQYDSTAGTSSQDHHHGHLFHLHHHGYHAQQPRHRISIESEGRSSMASVSQTSRASNRRRFGDFLRGSWLPYGDSGRRSRSRPGTMSSRDAASPVLGSATGTATCQADVPTPTDDGPWRRSQLRIDAAGAARNPASPAHPHELEFGATSATVATFSSSASSSPQSQGAGFQTSEDRAKIVDLCHDDVDLDLELSDDDFDDEARPAGAALASNNGSGWMLREDAAYLPEIMQQRRSDVSSQDVLTASVEGGYNVFKPPYRHLLPQPDGTGSSPDPDPDRYGASSTEGTDALQQSVTMLALSSEGASLPTFELQLDLSSEAEALRRADASVLSRHHAAAAANGGEAGASALSQSYSSLSSPSRHSHSNDGSRPPSQMGSVPEDHAGTGFDEHDGRSMPLATAEADKQFADADEAEAAKRAAAREAEMAVDAGGGGGVCVDDDEDADSKELCVSFKAKKSSRRLTAGRK